MILLIVAFISLIVLSKLIRSIGSIQKYIFFFHFSQKSIAIFWQTKTKKPTTTMSLKNYNLFTRPKKNWYEHIIMLICTLPPPHIIACYYLLNCLIDSKRWMKMMRKLITCSDFRVVINWRHINIFILLILLHDKVPKWMNHCVDIICVYLLDSFVNTP